MSARPWQALALAALVSCGEGPAARDVANPVPLRLVWELPPDFTLDEARLQVNTLILDRCGGSRMWVPVDQEISGQEALFLLPGGYCGLHLVLGEGVDLRIRGHFDGERVDAQIDLPGIVALEPFLVDKDVSLLLVVPLARLADPKEPVVASVWIDRDADGQLGPGDVPAGIDQGADPG